MTESQINPQITKYLAEGAQGPAMSALPNDRQRAFVVACTQPNSEGQVNYTQAARDAGYDGEPHNLKVQAHRLAHDPRVQAAMLEESQNRMGAALPLATAVLIQIMTQSTKPSDQMKAAQMIMNRTGLHEKTEHTVTVTKTESRGEQLERAIRLAKELGLDPAAALGKIGMTIDGRSLPAIDTVPAPVNTEVDDDWLR